MHPATPPASHKILISYGGLGHQFIAIAQADNRIHLWILFLDPIEMCRHHLPT